MIDFVLAGLAAASPLPPRSGSDTIRVEVGSASVDGRVYTPHAARVTVRVGSPDSPPVANWTNELTLGDSAGRRVMRWVTKGARADVTWELRQTYDAVTLAPYGYHSTSSTGAYARLAIDGSRVTGVRRGPRDSAETPITAVVERPGFYAGASDLVPTAVGLKADRVIIAPVWTPNAAGSELRSFSVRSKGPVMVEGNSVDAWRVEERKYPEGTLVATWYLTEQSPYMVYGEVPLGDGRVQLMSEVAIPSPGR